MSKDKFVQVAVATPFDNTTPVGTIIGQTDVQNAIEYVYNLAKNASRGSTICGFDGTASTNRYLEFSANNPSDTNPFIIPEPSVLRAIAVSAASNSTGTVTVYKNGSSVASLNLVASRKAADKTLNVSFTDLDEVSVKVSSGSISRPTFFIFIQTL